MSEESEKECLFIEDWADPKDCDCPHDGYSRDDCFYKYTVEVNGKCEVRIGRSLTAGKNKDHPEDGSRKANPTWEAGNFCYWFKKLLSCCDNLPQKTNQPPLAGFSFSKNNPVDTDIIEISSTASDPENDVLSCTYTLEET